MGKSRHFGAKASDKLAENKDKGQLFDSWLGKQDVQIAEGACIVYSDK